MGLFPSYIENNISLKAEQQKAMPKEYEIDFETGQLTGGVAEGKEAIKIWIWLALQTPRYRYYAYTWDYGSEFEDLIGKGYTEEYIEAEVQQMTEECLLINENIQSIEIKLLAIDNYTVIAEWLLKQNDEEYDGIYEIKFNENLECIYFKSWEMIK